MISRLNVTRFGKFVDRVFPFGVVTVFHGRNEAGKTTLFDALFDALCDIDGTTTAGRALTARYGAKGKKNSTRLSSIEYDGEAFAIPADDFLGIYAVKSGELTTRYSSDGEWKEHVKTSLLTGGIDPVAIRRELERMSSERKNQHPMLGILGKKGERDKLQGKLEDMIVERDSILASEGEAREIGDDLTSLKEKKQEKEQELADARKTFDLQGKERERKKLYELLGSIEGYREKKAELEEKKMYRDDCSSKLAAHELAITRAHDDCVPLDGKKKFLVEEIERIQLEMDAMKVRLDSMSRSLFPLSDLKDHIDRERPKAIIRESATWNKALLAVAIVLAVAGAAAGAIMGFPMPGAVILGACVIIGFVLAIKSHAVMRTEEVEDLAPFTRTMMNRWREITGTPVEGIETIDELRDRIVSFKNEYTTMKDLHADKGKQLVEKKNDVKHLGGQADKLRQAEKDAIRARDAWYRLMNVTSREEYGKKLQEYRSLDDSCKKLGMGLKPVMEVYGCSDLTTLKSKIEVVVNSFGIELDSVIPMPENEFKRLEKMIKSIEEQIDTFHELELSQAKNYHGLTGEIKGALGGLPGSIFDLRKRIETLDREIKDLDLDRRAAGFAAKIVAEIAQNATVQFDVLSRDVAERFGEFLPGGGHGENPVFQRQGHRGEGWRRRLPRSRTALVGDTRRFLVRLTPLPGPQG